MTRWLQRLLLCLPAVFWVMPATAHYLDIAQFSLFQGQSEGRFRLVVDNLPENLNPVQPVSWPDGCTMISRNESLAGAAPRVEFEAECTAAPAGKIETQWGQDGAIVELHYRDGGSTSTLQSGSRQGSTITVPNWSATEPATQGFWETAWLYLKLGTEHVLIGWDHLAFVFCLSMLASGASLVWLISSFTVGHSLSLALAHFGLVNVPIAPVEAIIALSVVFMAREALFMQRRSDWRRRESTGSTSHPPPGRLALTAGFGLVHGLGFASVLGGLGVSPTETATALLFFNVGVEVGQILFVLAVLAVVFLVGAVRLDRPLARTAICSVGGMGIVWTVQRVIGV